MSQEIIYTRNKKAEDLFGVETLNIGCVFQKNSTRNQSLIKVICELKFEEDKKTANKEFVISFTVKDNEGRLVGLGQKIIWKKKDFFVEGAFDVYVECQSKADNIKEIKCLITCEN